MHGAPSSAGRLRFPGHWARQSVRMGCGPIEKGCEDDECPDYGSDVGMCAGLRGSACWMRLERLGGKRFGDVGCERVGIRFGELERVDFC